MLERLLNRRSEPAPPSAPAYGAPRGARADPFYRDRRREASADAATWVPPRRWFSRRQPEDADRR
jgi:hypothetical protein